MFWSSVKKYNILYNYVTKKPDNSEILNRISGLEKSVSELSELKDETETIVKWLVDVSEKLKLYEINTISINTQLNEMSKKMEEMQCQMQAQEQRMHLYEQLQEQMQHAQDQMQDQMQNAQAQAEQEQAEQEQAQMQQVQQEQAQTK